MTNRAVSKWETGEGYPDITVLPALAEILNVSVDELLNGENKPSGHQPDDINYVKETMRQAEYLLESSLRQFSYLYLISLGIVLFGIIASSLSLKLYNGIFLSSLSYTLIISLSFLAIGMMFYINICKNLNAVMNKYNSILGRTEAEFYKYIYKKHVLFFPIYLMQVTICIGIIPLYPFMSTGYYRAFHTIFGYTTGVGRLVIDQNFCIFLCLALYCVLFVIGNFILMKKFGKR